MPGLGEGLGGIGSSAQQLFLWSVLSPIINELLQPFIRALDQRVNAEHPNLPLTPEQLADMVERGHLEAGAAASEAALSGINAARFDRLVANTGEPPGPLQLAEMLRRRIIERSGGDDRSPTYEQGIRQSRLQTQWGGAIEALDKRLPGPEAAVLAAIRNLRDEVEAQRLHEVFGGDPEYWRLETELAGEGPTPNEAAAAAHRGKISWTGLGPGSTSFEQIVAESRYKNKFVQFYRDVSEYRPPPRTVTAMLRGGDISLELATQYLLDYGVPQEALSAYTGRASKGAVARAHVITETEIIRLYTERGLDAAETAQHLAALGYSAEDAGLIIAAADLEYQGKLTTATIAAVRSLYLHQHIDANGAIARLDARGVRADYRDSLLQLWDLERDAGLKSLTVKQILQLWAEEILSEDDARRKLRESGYSAEDTELLIFQNRPRAGSTTGEQLLRADPGLV